MILKSYILHQIQPSIDLLWVCLLLQQRQLHLLQEYSQHTQSLGIYVALTEIHYSQQPFFQNVEHFFLQTFHYENRDNFTLWLQIIFNQRSLYL